MDTPEMFDILPRNWRKWQSRVIERFIAAHQDLEEENVITLIEDMEDELDNRENESVLISPWDAREGARPHWA
jgi:hypothetical protein